MPIYPNQCNVHLTLSKLALSLMSFVCNIQLRYHSMVTELMPFGDISERCLWVIGDVFG